MMRWVVCLAAGLMAVACQSQVSGVGEGPLIMSEQARDQLRTWRGPERLTDMTVAIERNSRSMGASHCAVGAGNCLQDAGIQAIDLCEKDGRFECYVLFHNDDIVWQGPIYVMNRAVRQAIPWHGRWPVEIRREGEPAAGATVVVSNGRRWVEGLSGDKPCRSNLQPRGREGGRFSIQCPDGYAVSGQYKSAPRVIHGSGTGSDGRELAFTIDFSAGEGLPPFSGY
ncbi:MAG: hypothetical protein ACMVY4_13515 [Minwuia sp.]|uniref:hypothetical protein n=1 Tax=Minwuia sp. TaxID=2493630 RepID=UPI003A85B108